MNESTLMGLMGSLFRRPAYDDIGSAAAGGRAHIRATVGRRGRRIRSGGRVYGMNGPQACERRRRQAERLAAKRARRAEREVA